MIIDRMRELIKLKRAKEFYVQKLNEEGFDTTIEEVQELMAEIRSGNNLTNTEEKSDYGLTEEKIDNKNGTKQLTYVSDKPLSIPELEELAGVDNLTVVLDKAWLKSHKNGQWTYSILLNFLTRGFTSGRELEDKLKKLFPKNLQKFVTPKVKPSKGRTVIVTIADDHCGLILTDSQYGNEQSESIYRERLDKIYKKLLQQQEIFDKLILVSLGDELDGFNGYTTRGGHYLGSASNQTQFDIYVESRKEFYDKLFQSGIANTYMLINQNISNHSGNGLSYISNRALEIYIDAVYEGVKILQSNKMIQPIEIGNHVFGFVHGKDEKHQKNPMPLNLDAKTDTYLFEFYDKLGYSASKNWISTIKADIHKFNINMGKHGRYVNCPSISSGSNWIEANFGNSKPGALIELVDPNDQDIVSIPVWF